MKTIYTPKENMLRLMNLPLSRFDGVVRTTDGFYIAQVKGDLGYMLAVPLILCYLGLAGWLMQWLARRRAHAR